MSTIVLVYIIVGTAACLLVLSAMVMGRVIDPIWRFIGTVSLLFAVGAENLASG